MAPRVYERPAVPKRVVLLDALPMTAIGKVFKPDAAAARDRDQAGRNRWVSGRAGVSARVRAREQGGRQCAVITVPGPHDEALHERLMQGLAAIAVQTELRFE